MNVGMDQKRVLEHVYVINRLFISQVEIIMEIVRTVHVLDQKMHKRPMKGFKN